jgi:Rieske 2Fe-2S protein
LPSPDPGEIEYTRLGDIIRCPWHGWEFDIRTGQSYGDPKRFCARDYHLSRPSIRLFPYFLGGLTTAIACYVEAGRLEDARRVKAQVLQLAPHWRLKPIGTGPIRSVEVARKMLEAGMPE